MASPLLLFGASIRAAAISARRANLDPWGADLFLDADLHLAGTSFQRINDYSELLAISERGPPGPWMYTGALENRPALVKKIARHRNLWGNSAEILRQVRSPLTVFNILNEADIPCPRVGPTSPAGSIRWLRKPKAGAGGKGITWWAGQSLSRRHYLQEYVEGESCAAVFVAKQGRASLLGVTRQLVGQAWLHAGPFQYCGSVGPLTLDPSMEQAWLRLGNALAAGFQLQGLFGVDCIVRDQIPWPVEVNPRYTASVEVLELAGGMSALREHQRVFVGPDAAFTTHHSPLTTHHTGIIGKAILFARAPLIFPNDGPWRQSLSPENDPWIMPAFADIPAAGQPIARHDPILSLFVRADTIAGCVNQLQTIAADLDRLLFPS
jgi:predicted ATP-grasp superfamily ATP-dependent carboligase